MMDYQEFLETKRLEYHAAGFEVEESELNPMLFDFQKAVVRWALRRGKAAIFADCGLGKTPMQLDWAHQVAERTGKDVLILAPLAVSTQTVEEGEKFHIQVYRAESDEDIRGPISISNYQRLHRFDPERFGGIVLDESSILKAYEGYYRQELTDFAQTIPYRLCCTATPAPNDITEIINHSEFLSILNGKEILALFFIQDGNTTHKWRLKRHGEESFWKWMASWAVAFRSPEDLGFNGDAFRLPELRFVEHVVEGESNAGELFTMEARTLSERREARRESINERVQMAADIVAKDPNEPWLIWCDLNAESALLSDLIEGAIEVKGSDTNDHKSETMLGFAHGDVHRIVTKPTIAGFGMNWQRCARMVFVGLSDSYEQLYQATRRCWRFGQDRDVEAHIVISEKEGSVRDNIKRKERQSQEMFDNLIEHLKLYQMDKAERQEHLVDTDHSAGQSWDMYLGDSHFLIDDIETDSIGLSVFSPPFPGMYTYTNSAADVGNSKDVLELVDHMRHILGREKLLRVTKPGRHACVHLTQAVAYKWLDGYIGIKDFRGEVIRMMEDEGWIYYGEVCIDKNPQVKAIRTKDRGLLFKTLANDASHLHPALADYLLQFRKPGDSEEPIRAGISEQWNNLDGWVTNEQWIEWAHPVWYTINETNVLNVKQARDQADEKHLCPLQLDVIERAVMLWSNPGDIVLSPFAGIGSEGYVALLQARRFIGFELKRSYYDAAVKNLHSAESIEGKQGKLFG